jgi:hypothetical protein
VGYRPDDVSKLIQATILSDIHRWNLAINLPFNVGFKAPFFEETDNYGDFTNRRLNNGRPYLTSDLDEFLLTGIAPFEAPARYSETLRETIRSCLRYMPGDRVGIEQLKEITDWERGRHMADEDTGNLRVYIDGEMEQFRIGNNYVPRDRGEEGEEG